MNKNLKIYSFLFLSILWVESPLQAVGGSKVEEVPLEEIKRRGILKIQHADDSSAFGTAVLFREGKGQLGLGAKHVFKKDCAKFAYLGEEKREIIKVYKSTYVGDLVLFVLSDPFKDTDEFPTLPALSSEPPVYEGCVYGYGATTLSYHPGSLEKSEGICRKGEIFMTPLSNIWLDTDLLMRKGENLEQTNDILMSLSTFQEKGVTDHLLFTDKRDKLNKIIINKEYLPLVKNDLSDDSWLLPSYILPYSPSCLLGGDSGGPVISEDNQIYALAFCILPNIRPNMRTDFLYNIIEEKNYKQYFKLTIFGLEISIGFVPGEESILHIGLPIKDLCCISDYLSLREAIPDLFFKDFTNYFGKGKSEIFHPMVKIEKEEQNSSYLYNWLKSMHLYNINFFTSIVSHRKWIADTIPIAFRYIKKQMANISTKAKHIDNIPKKGKKQVNDYKKRAF